MTAKALVLIYWSLNGVDGNASRVEFLKLVEVPFPDAQDFSDGSTWGKCRMQNEEWGTLALVLSRRERKEQLAVVGCAGGNQSSSRTKAAHAG
jgi:formylmethanofuran dehydrogenase subunit E